ncbi:hypothetical protein SNEBB_009359 [Seison nebaliae]|nr:hypothetical protein SNEBB_009359 [Seison nebaliae]
MATLNPFHAKQYAKHFNMPQYTQPSKVHEDYSFKKDTPEKHVEYSSTSYATFNPNCIKFTNVPPSKRNISKVESIDDFDSIEDLDAEIPEETIMECPNFIKPKDVTIDYSDFREYDNYKPPPFSYAFQPSNNIREEDIDLAENNSELWLYRNELIDIPMKVFDFSNVFPSIHTRSEIKEYLENISMANEYKFEKERLKRLAKRKNEDPHFYELDENAFPAEIRDTSDYLNFTTIRYIWENIEEKLFIEPSSFYVSIGERIEPLKEVEFVITEGGMYDESRIHERCFPSAIESAFVAIKRPDDIDGIDETSVERSFLKMVRKKSLDTSSFRTVSEHKNNGPVFFMEKFDQKDETYSKIFQSMEMSNNEIESDTLDFIELDDVSDDENNWKQNYTPQPTNEFFFDYSPMFLPKDKYKLFESKKALLGMGE